MNAAIRFTVFYFLFLSFLSAENAFEHKHEEQFVSFKKQADGLKCNICKNIISSPSVWEEKLGSSLVAQLKHCHELFQDHKGSPLFQAAMFACHEFARDDHARHVLSSLDSLTGAANCSRFC